MLLLIAISSQLRQRPHYYLVTLLSRLISSPVRLLTRYLLHLSYDWSLYLAQLTPACGVTSFRFVQAATALHPQHSVALLPPLAMGTRHYSLLSVFSSSFPSTVVLQHVIVPSTDSPTFTRLLTAVPTVRCFLTSSLVIVVGGAGFEPAKLLTFQTLAFLPSSTRPTTLSFISLTALAGHHRAPCAVASSSGSTSLSGVLCPEHLSLLHTHEAMSVRISSATPS